MIWRIHLALALSVTALQAQSRIGEFWYAGNIDPITDEDRSYIWTYELHPTAIRNGRLMWRCDGATLELALLADEFLNDDPIPMVWRFDRNEPHQSRWNPSTNRTSAFAPSRDLNRFTAAALPASTVVIRATNYRGVDYTYEFSLAGLTAGLRRLRCTRSTLAEIQEQSEEEIQERSEEEPLPTVQVGERWSVKPSTGDDIVLWRELARFTKHVVLEPLDVIIVRNTPSRIDRQMVMVEVISREHARNSVQGWLLLRYFDNKMDEDSCFLKFVGAFVALRDRCIGR